LGITTQASRRTYGRTCGVFCHSCAAMHPACDRPTTPSRTRPKKQARSFVQIVTKYQPGAA
jgi:hypothetical protein